VFTETGVVVCDSCRRSRAVSEADAAARGWAIDVTGEQHAHLCPDCQSQPVGRPSLY
jgi:hypothetical protein